MAEVDLENADWMVASEGKVWILSDPEIDDDLSVFEMKVIDPETNEIVFTVDRARSGCEGLGVGASSVFVCDQDEILQLDSQTGEELARINFPMSSTQGPIPTDERGLWLLTREETELVHLDFAGSELGRVELPGVCEQVALFNGEAFVSCPESRVVLVITGEYAVSRQLEDIEAGLLTGGNDRVWLGFPHDQGGVGWIKDDEVGTVAGSPDLSLGCLLVDGEDVWVRGSDIHLARIDGGSGEIVESYQSERAIGGGCVVRVGESLWIGSLPFGKVWRLET